MSEYYYYEFVAVDGPISDEGMSYARGCSTRAQVSRYHWRNVYNWGSFRGSPMKLLQYYDAHVYAGNWRSFVFAIGLPSDCVDVQLVRPYLSADRWGDGVQIAANRKRIVILWQRDGEECGYEGGEEEGLLDNLVGIRGEVLRGDLRPFFLGWLAGAGAGHRYEGLPRFPPEWPISVSPSSSSRTSST